jgi:hypothetical protein
VPRDPNGVRATGSHAKQIRDFFSEAIRLIEGIPADFVFNMDEMGHQEWAERKEQICTT